jgi:hypothetical protein
VVRALEGGEAARGGEGAPGSGGGRCGGEAGGRLRWKTALTGGPHLSAARGGERELAGRRDWMGRLLFGPRGLKDRWVGAGGLEWVRVSVCFVFFSFLFFSIPFSLISFPNFYSKSFQNF